MDQKEIRNKLLKLKLKAFVIKIDINIWYFLN